MNDTQARARWALLFGNFVIGTGVLAPAGLINEIGSAFAVDVATAGSLIGYGAAVLCIEAPLLAFATNRVDRRVLLTAALALYVIGHAMSAFAPSSAHCSQFVWRWSVAQPSSLRRLRVRSRCSSG